MKALIGFAGGDGVGVGMKAAGVLDTIGIELDDEIASVARANGHNVITADILEVDPAEFTDCDLMHMSPPCPNFSQAKTGGSETELDIALAKKIIEFLRVIKPKIFTLENVYMYRKSYSMLLIGLALQELGYTYTWWHCNFADYGLAQTRKRFILIAWDKATPPPRPFPTHQQTPDLFSRPWVGWYEAIEELIPTLPDAEFTPWQLERLPDEMQTVLINPNRTSMAWVQKTDAVVKDRPMPSICAQYGADINAFILGQGSYNSPKAAGLPADTVTANSNQTGVKAFLVNGGTTDSRSSVTSLADTDPAFTLTASINKRPSRAYANGRVVSLTPRALARLQSFPDSYELPEHSGLACKIIGNAVPPMGYKAIIKNTIEQYEVAR
jgi:DNA-cytosine methyltransferase